VGTLLIFERGPIEDGEADLSYATIPIFFFFHSLRSPAFYQEQFRELGLQDITVKNYTWRRHFLSQQQRKRFDSL